MDFTHFTAGKDDEGKRFDKVARKMLAAAHLSSLYKNIRTGFLRLNGKKAKAETRVLEGDQIGVATFLLEDAKPKAQSEGGARLPENFPLPIIFENEAILIVSKPYGLTVQKASSAGKSTTEKNLCVAELMKFFFQSNSLSFVPAPLHRIDRQTTGLLVCSKNILGARWFSELVAGRKIKKNYLAVIEGVLEAAEKWTDFIEIETKNQVENSGNFHTVKIKSLNSVAKNDEVNFIEKKIPGGKKSLSAVTNVLPTAIGQFGGKKFTLAKLEIETGRKHQIRAQASMHGHALLGDTAYGAQKIPDALFESCGQQQLFLHAHEIVFPQNALGVPQKISAPLPENFQKLLGKLLIDFS